jgi:thioredoxin reductase (NADPH)
MSENVKEVVILGTGPAGLTAGLYTARANLAPTIYHGPQPGGQLTTTTEVENFPGFSKGIMGPDLMVEMEQQAKRFGAEVIQSRASKVELDGPIKKIWFGEEVVETKVLIIATGATARTLGLPREAEMMGFGLSTCATCDGAFFRDQVIIVIGGGDSACEEAIFLTKFGSKVILVHRRDELRASQIMADRVKQHPKVEIVWDNELVELKGDRKSGLTGGVFKNTKTGELSEIPGSALFYAIGHTPTTELFKGILEMDENGYLIAKPDSTQTNIKGVFACGDVKDHVYRQAITAAGSGCMAAIEAERYLAELE